MRITNARHWKLEAQPMPSDRIEQDLEQRAQQRNYSYLFTFSKTFEQLYWNRLTTGADYLELHSLKTSSDLDKSPSTVTTECQGHSHPKLLELKTQGHRVHNSSALSCSQWFPGQRLFPLGYLSTNSYRTHFNCLLIKGLRVVGGDELSSSCKDERASTFSSIQVFGKSGGE